MLNPINQIAAIDEEMSLLEKRKIDLMCAIEEIGAQSVQIKDRGKELTGQRLACVEYLKQQGRYDEYLRWFESRPSGSPHQDEPAH